MERQGNVGKEQNQQNLDDEEESDRHDSCFLTH